MTDTDALVVGAGVVGLACARAVAARGHGVLVLERHERFGVETSSRNSEVVHAGIHYPPGSLKARLCVRGREMLYRWCVERGVPHRRLGKLVVATTEGEEAHLESIRATAEACGAGSLRRLSADEVRSLEPNVRCTAALWSPDTGIVDSHALMASLLADAEANGAAVAYRQQVVAAERSPGGHRVVARDASGAEADLEARWVVNSAGLDADTVAARAGFDVAACGYGLHYAWGRYFRVSDRRRGLVSRLVYPTPRTDGLGVHATLDLAGGMRLGPDVEYLGHRRQEYEVPDALREPFHAAASRYLEGLEPEDLAPDLAGIRPKLQGPGGGFRDFVISEEADRGRPGWVNLVGIESPGLTCCLAIGEMVADILEGTT